MKIGSGATTDKSIASGDPVITTPNRSAETRPAPTPMMKMVPIALAVPLLVGRVRSGIAPADPAEFHRRAKET